MKRGTTEHPKFRHLCKLLNLEIFAAVGVLETLWHFTAKFAPQGDLGRFTDEEIAAAIGWNKRSGRAGVSSGSYLVGALVTSGWLEVPPRVPVGSGGGPIRVMPRSLLVHDWADHADQQVKRFLASRNLTFASLPEPLPEPEPLPAPAPAAPQPQAIVVEFPKSAEFIKRKFPTTDDAMVRSIVDRAVQEVIGAGEAPELVTDEVLLEALLQCTTKKQYSAALYLNTVGTWMRNMASTE